MSARHRLSKLLLRRGIVYYGGKPWTANHDLWLRAQRRAEVFTVPVGLGQMIVADVQPWGELMAASLLTALPVIVIYVIGQRFMVAGLTAGSVKG